MTGQVTKRLHRDVYLDRRLRDIAIDDARQELRDSGLLLTGQGTHPPDAVLVAPVVPVGPEGQLFDVTFQWFHVGP